MRWQLNFSGGQRGIDVFVGNWRNPVSLLLHWIQCHCRAQIKSKTAILPLREHGKGQIEGELHDPRIRLRGIFLFIASVAALTEMRLESELIISYLAVSIEVYRRPLVRLLVGHCRFMWEMLCWFHACGLHIEPQAPRPYFPWSESMPDLSKGKPHSRWLKPSLDISLSEFRWFPLEKHTKLSLSLIRAVLAVSL
jgi:hypothetical protein